MAAPSATEQVAFLRDLQRLLDEGQFVSTYKFALLLALADLAVEQGDDSGDALPLSLERIADHFVSLYWRHVNPFPAIVPEGRSPRLWQNLGPQNIELIGEICWLQERCPTLAQ